MIKMVREHYLRYCRLSCLCLGGEGHKGKVSKLENWNSTCPRSAVSVIWEHGVENLYRIGFEGMVSGCGSLS